MTDQPAGGKGGLGEQVGGVRQFLAEHPDVAQVVDPVVRVRRVGPLGFLAEDDQGHLVGSDMPVEVGGAAAHMAPGSLLRSALGTCEATRVAMEAAVRGVELSTLEVEVESTSDHRGLFGIADAEPGPLTMAVRYRLASPTASKDELHALVTEPGFRSPVLSALTRIVAVDIDIAPGSGRR